ncbi:MAG: bifunctional nuclease family protein [Candidatus Omnitrophota bacterium]
MELNKIIIDEKRHDQIIVLKEKNGPRLLPIVIGFLEVSSIKMKVSGIEPPRPLTHDLLKSVIDNLGARIEKVVIDKLEHNTFYAKLYLNNSNKTNLVIDARPSDSIALAVRADAPIFVEDDVIKQSEFLKEK